MSESMIERVARALCERRKTVLETTDLVTKYGATALSWDDAGDLWRNRYRDEARIALAALREPTEAMLDAITNARHHAVVRPDKATSKACWHAGIDAALTSR